MILDIKNDEYETITTRIVCPYHKQHPNRTWSGCTCRTLTERKRISKKDEQKKCLKADL